MPVKQLTLRVRRFGVTNLLAIVMLFSVHLAFAQSGKPTVTAPFVPLKGPFAVGTHEYLWVDQNRAETFTKDPSDRRHLLVRVWYPAEPTPALQPALYVSDVNEFPEKSVYRRGAGFKTNSASDAPIAKGTTRFPVLIY